MPRKVRREAVASFDPGSPNSEAVRKVRNFSYKPSKMIVRGKILELAMNMDSVSALTFPGTDWALETALLSHCNELHITALEYVKEIFDAASFFLDCHVKKTDLKEKINYLPFSDKDYLRHALPNEKFNLVWLDWMSLHTDDTINTIDLLVPHLENEAYVAITFVAALEHKGKINLFDEKYGGKNGDGNYHTARVAYAKDTIAEVAEKHKFKTELIEGFSYKDQIGNVTGYPMIYMCMKFNKEVHNA